MKKITVLLVSVLVSAMLFAQKTINDPNAEARTVGSFHGIRVGNAFEVFINQGNEDAVAVSAAKQEIKEKIITKVENGILIIRLEEDKKFWKNWNNGKQKLKAYISIKKIDRIDIGGACNVYFEEGLSAEGLTIDLSGASDMKGKLDAKTVKVDISGASSATISGNAPTLAIEASGASDFKGFDLVTNFCDAKATGASSINITVNKELNANASGASSVRFKGDGLIRDIKTSGASNVTRKS
jgi:hypothetical protein